MSLLLLGANGQVGWELQRALAPVGPLVALDRAALDLTDGTAILQAIKQYQPDVLINAAAHTAVDKAESEPDLAHAINADAVRTMAEGMQRQGGWLVHYSTDYVFSGTGNAPYRETDKTGPLNVYGASKLRGEDAVRESGVHHLLFRTSWVYSTRSINFPNTILRLAREREQLRVVSDQHGAPTHAALIADATAHCLHRVLHTPKHNDSGTYHLAAAGVTNWHAFAQYLIARAPDARCRPEGVAAICSDDYPTAAKRPLNSRLSTEKLARQFDLGMPDWTLHAQHFMEEYRARSAA